jgi:hypothetical protein
VPILSLGRYLSGSDHAFCNHLLVFHLELSKPQNDIKPLLTDTPCPAKRASVIISAKTELGADKRGYTETFMTVPS